MTLQLPLWLQRRNHKPSEGHLDSSDQQGDPRIRPCRSSRFPATNLKICLTPNGTVDRSATNFERKIFEGKNFVMSKAVFFGIFRVSLVYFFEQICSKKLWYLQFSRHARHAPPKFLSICDLLKFSRNSKIYTRCFCRVSVYSLRHSKLEISISQFSTKMDPCFT
jgi:hypothetical protein